MIRQAYIEFIEKFGGLSPYELDHLCKIIHQYYQKNLEALGQEPKSVSLGDLKEILIRSMQAAQIELAERKLKEAELNLTLTKSRIYQE